MKNKENIENERKMSKKEWNKIAKEYYFLSSVTLRAIYKKSFYEICKEIRMNEE